MWAMGDYPAVATEVIAALGPSWSRPSASRPGDHVLDVGAGSGNAAIPAALAGADVVASDLTPDLLETGRQARRAGRRAAALGGGRRGGAAVRRRRVRRRDLLRRRDVRPAPPGALPTSWCGCVRPGGRIGLLSWTPAGFIGQMFATMKPFAPPPPPGAQPPPLWGDEAHVRELLGDRVTDVRRRPDRSRCRCSRTARRSATSSSAPTDRPSPSTGSWPTTRPARPSSTRPSLPTATATSATASWSGSTCCSARRAYVAGDGPVVPGRTDLDVGHPLSGRPLDRAATVVVRRPGSAAPSEAGTRTARRA